MPTITFTAAYTWDNEGRMTAQQNPTVRLPYQWYPAVLGTEGFSYDTDGRMTGMTLDTGNGPMPYASATYGPAGEMQSLSYLGMTEQRSYNSLLQMTHQWVSGMMDMTYNYSLSANNGRITGSTDAVANETTSHTYDALNRLTGAANGHWTAGYTYDGFGNLTSKTGTGGAPYMAAVTYDVNNHQTGISYDANGNQAVGFYSIENRLTSFGNTEYEYDPFGKRVAVKTPNDDGTTNYQFSFYGITGQRLATVGCTENSDFRYRAAG